MGVGLVVVAQGRRRRGPRRRRRRGLGRRSSAGSPTRPTTSTCSTSSPTRWSGAGSTSTTSSRRCANRPGRQYVVVTGRRADPRLVEVADLVTEMTKVKHPMDARPEGPEGHRVVSACPASVDRRPGHRAGQDHRRHRPDGRAAPAPATRSAGTRSGPTTSTPATTRSPAVGPAATSTRTWSARSAIVPLLLHGAAGADVAVIEGVMGLYDGRVGGRRLRLDRPRRDAHAARPVVLVVDISRSSRSIGAVVHGMATWDPDVRRRRRDPQPGRLAPARATRSRDSIDLPVLGVARRATPTSPYPSRHLGLVPAAERDEAGARARPPRRPDRRAPSTSTPCSTLARAGAGPRREPWDLGLVTVASDLDSALATVRDQRRPWWRWPAGGRSRSATPRPRSCSRAAGCAVVTFDPLVDPRLPDGHRGDLPRRRLPRGARRASSPPTCAARRELAAARRATASRPSPSAPGCSTSAATLDGAPMAGVDRGGGRDDRAADAALPDADRDHRLAAHPGGRAGHRPRVPPHPGHAGAGARRWAFDGVHVGFASRPCTRRTCTPTGPATPSSPSGSRTRCTPERARG